MLPDPNPMSSPRISGSMYAARKAMEMASRYSRRCRSEAGSGERICSRVYRFPVFSHEASHVMRPVASRPTMPS